MRNNPDHYKIDGKDTIKTIIGIVDNNHLKTEESIYLFNTLKYLVRFNNKNGLEDLVKAKDYLERLMEVYKKGETKMNGLKQISTAAKILRLNLLKEKIEQWAIERELDKKGTVEGQQIKTAEEVAELIIGISKERKETIKDSIGDIYVTLVIGNILDKKLDFKEINKSSCKLADKVSLNLDKYKDNKQAVILCMEGITTSVLQCGYKNDILENAIMNLMGAATAYELDFVDCVESAYEEISDRKGQMVNGTFVKESDLSDTTK